MLFRSVYLLRKVLEKKGTNVNRVYSQVNTHFDLCLTLCRTSSESVRHEVCVYLVISNFPNSPRAYAAHERQKNSIDEFGKIDGYHITYIPVLFL